jgi:hypothetical protein
MLATRISDPGTQCEFAVDFDGAPADRQRGHGTPGRVGELRQRYREGQEDQPGALGLMLNALILWNTRYMDAAFAHLRASVRVIKPEDAARLSRLGSNNFNV